MKTDADFNVCQLNGFYFHAEFLKNKKNQGGVSLEGAKSFSHLKPYVLNDLYEKQFYTFFWCHGFFGKPVNWVQ